MHYNNNSNGKQFFGVFIVSARLDAIPFKHRFIHNDSVEA